MPFDGRAYFGPLPLLAPIYNHPDAPAVAEVTAESLRGGYQHLRHNGKLIGHQTYGAYLRSPLAYNSTRDAFIASTWTDVADFDGAHVPAEATHIYAEAHYRMVNGDGVILFHRIRIDVGGANDVGDQVREARDAAPPTPAGWGVPDVPFTLFQPGDPLNGVAVPHVVMSNVNGSLPADSRIRVQAYALTEGGNPQAYTPLFVAAFWAAVG